MMDSDPKNYPSRMFIRFTARNQLIADATGRPIAAMVQRLGGDAYVQRVNPETEAPALAADDDADGFLEGVSLEMSPDLQTQSGTPETETGKDASQGDVDCCVDDALFAEIVKTTLNPSHHPELYQPCQTSQLAKAIEASVAAEIVATYRQIKRKQTCPIVQGLNKLL
ncbi:MAG: hypothetical protein F6J95_004645 [Leptolyngbya sp. SIO1E4]|nr:hypothetical protein [Leptolyngbya sp. SIO1E4]